MTGADKTKHMVKPTNEETAMSSYVLSLMRDDGLYTLRLPSSTTGEVPFIVKGKTMLTAYVREGSWVASGSSCTILDKSSAYLQDIELCDDGHWYLIGDGNRQILFSESASRVNYGYVRYVVSSPATIRIGRGSGNDIQFKNPYVSKNHAALAYRNGQFHIDDLDSANGIFVNGVRTRSRDLSLGDVVSILSMRIIIGTEFIAINSGKRSIEVSSRSLERFVFPSSSSVYRPENKLADPPAASYFNRLPRRRLPMRVGDIDIELPPFKISDTGIPLMLRMGGSVATGAASIFTGNPIMLLSTILFPFLSEKYTEKQREDYETRRVVTYTGYLKGKQREIDGEKLCEEHVLRENYPTLDTVLEYPLSGEKLWERRKTDDDFLSLRLGAGKLPMGAKIKYPSERLSLEEDALEDEMFDLAKAPVFLDDVPIMLDLLEHRMCGVVGDKARQLEFAKQIVLRIAMLHSYDEVKLVILARPADMEAFAFARYLPHVWNDQRTMRFLASSPSDAYLVGEYLAKTLEEDAKNPRQLKHILRDRPYYVVIAVDKQLQDCMEIIKTSSQLDDNCGISVISVFDEIPKECTAQVTLKETGLHSLSNLRDVEREDERFAFDAMDVALAARSAFAVSNTVLKAVDSTYSLPKSLTFLEMYSVGNIANLNIPKRWEESDPVSSLAVPVGVESSGAPFTLDLHQKYQGPHGLVAGMTGSGKSEFLLTYILSLAINYRPDEVSFLLIDYKGGGLAGAFEDKRRGIRLPHLAGTITNLDGAAIQRSLISLQSETLRRQRVFNEAKTLSGESTMDIYTYQRLHRQGVVPEPVSHLFIISDEFAELHDQQPDFLDQLISIARIGRSLGIHLILATQKPGGLVNDQILSNTKFRVCLKVQTRSDSNDMLKRPEAAELQETGRFYLQVGYNELFSLGQSAWSGAPYAPQEEVVASEDISVTLIDDVGLEIASAKPKVRAGTSEGSQLSSIVNALAKLAGEMGLGATSLWVPPLAKSIELNELPEPQPDAASPLPLVAGLGLIDDPENQKQYALAIDLMSCNNIMVVGAARSGKTTFIQSLLLKLVDQCTPDQLNFYILDYSSRMLGMFRPFPHCGASLIEAAGEEVDAFFDLLDEIVDERKKLFESLGVDSYEAAAELQDIPVILVIIDNISGMSASKQGEDHAYRMDTHLKKGTQYGVKYLITCSHPNEVNIRARQEIDKRFALQAKDRYEYEEILGCRVSYLPPENPGRGLCVVGGGPLEMQIAGVGAHAATGERLALLKAEVSRLSNVLRTGKVAKRLPSIDESIGYEAFCNSCVSGAFPIGYHLETAKPISLPLRQFTGMSVYFGNGQGVLPVFNNIVRFASREGMSILAARRPSRSSLSDAIKAASASVAAEAQLFDTTDEGVASLVKVIMSEMQARQGLWNAFRSDPSYVEGAVDTFDYIRGATVPWLILFESFEELCYLSDEVTNGMSQLVPLMHEFNMYPIGCFYPDDKYGMVGRPLLEAFNRDDLVLLFGGRYAEQKCTDLPSELSRITAEIECKRCLMKYRGKFYSLLMPCDEVEQKPLHADEKSIFS